MSTLKATKSPFERSYDKQNITLVVISYEIYSKLAEGSFDKFLYEMTTSCNILYIELFIIWSRCYLRNSIFFTVNYRE